MGRTFLIIFLLMQAGLDKVYHHRLGDGSREGLVPVSGVDWTASREQLSQRCQVMKKAYRYKIVAFAAMIWYFIEKSLGQ